MQEIQEISYAHPAWIEIDLNQFKKNIKIIQAKVGRAQICLAVKANAYGHGLVPMAQAAVAAGVDYLGVSCLQEGAQLREAGIQANILVFGAIHEAQIRELLHYDLEFTISSHYKAMLVAHECQRLNKFCRVHLEVDTGMQRTGMRPQTTLTLLHDMTKMKCFQIVGVYSHLATADSQNHAVAAQQLATFQNLKQEIIQRYSGKMLFHIANSGGICNYPDSLFDMVRPGILAFGYLPADRSIYLPGIRPFFSLKAKIAYFKVVSAGSGISYGHTYTTCKTSRIVTVPVGYGDGFRRALSNKAAVLIRGKRYPVVGTICMDQFMVDIGMDEAYVGDEVVLIGRQEEEEICLAEIARQCDTISYEILCGFNQRLPRLYVECES